MAVSTWIRNSFVTGLIVVTPILITVLVLRVLFGWLVGVVGPMVAAADVARYTADSELVAQIVTGLALLAVVTLLGALVRVGIGRRTLERVDSLLELVPVVRTIYAGVRQVANTFLDRSTEFETVVFVNVDPGIYRIGFLAGDAPDTLREVAGQEVYNVFLPSSPNPTGGSLVLVEAEDVYESDLSVREGLRLLMTTGTATTEEEMAGKRLPGIDHGAVVEGVD